MGPDPDSLAEVRKKPLPLCYAHFDRYTEVVIKTMTGQRKASLDFWRLVGHEDRRTRLLASFL